MPASQGTVLDNIEAEQSDGKCNRKDTAGGEGSGFRVQGQWKTDDVLSFLNPEP